MTSLSYPQVRKYGLVIFLLLVIGSVLFFVYVNKVGKEGAESGERPSAEYIRTELSKPPDIDPRDGVVKPDGTVELSEEMKARIRRELQSNKP